MLSGTVRFMASSKIVSEGAANTEINKLGSIANSSVIEVSFLSSYGVKRTHLGCNSLEFANSCTSNFVAQELVDSLT